MMGRLCGLIVLLTFSASSLADDDHGKNVVSYTSDNFADSISNLPNFVMFFAPWCGHCKRLAPTWDKLAEKYNIDGAKVIIAKVDCTIEKDVCKEQGVTGYPTLKFFNKNADGERYKGGRDSDALEKFIAEKLGGGAATKATVPEEAAESLVVLDGKTFEKHIATGKHFVKFYAPWCGHCKRLAPTWVELADAYKGNEQVSIAKVDCTEESSKSVCTKYGVKGYPTLLFFNNGENEKYQQGRDLAALKKFVNEKTGAKATDDAKKHSTDGKIPEPSEKTKAPESAVVAYTADDFADGIAKGITFVKFYAPWCGHCKKMAPTWVELAEKYKDNKAVTIADVDCTVHREVCSKYEVKGFPTLKLFKDGELAAPYSGGRTLDAFTTFLKPHTGAAKDEL